VKTAVSIPDKVFRKAEALAKSLEISRSELYTNALANFVAERDEARVTERLNEVYASQSSALDPVIEKLQFLSLPVERW
jgi:metal-responsive CopG/Arc/MetJ family transcriptional regulator